MRFNYYKQKYDIKLSDIFEAPPVAPALEVPEEWINQVTTPAALAATKRASKSNATHLAPHRFTQGGKFVGEPNEANGNRMGPGMRNSQGALLDDEGLPYMGKPIGTLNSISQGPDHQIKSSLEKRLDASTNGHSEKLVRDDPLLEDLGARDARQWHGYNGRDTSMITETDPVGGAANSPSIGDDQYALIACNQGFRVAEAFTVINDSMAELSGSNELLEEVLSDMFMLLDENHQLDAFRNLYSQLPRSAQERLATSGL